MSTMIQGSLVELCFISVTQFTSSCSPSLVMDVSRMTSAPVLSVRNESHHFYYNSYRISRLYIQHYSNYKDVSVFNPGNDSSLSDRLHCKSVRYLRNYSTPVHSLLIS